MAGGRPKGSTDRKNNAIKDMILASLDEVGGKGYFVQQATENPAAYMGLIGKVLPKEVAVEIKRSIFEEDDESTGIEAATEN